MNVYSKLRVADQAVRLFEVCDMWGVNPKFMLEAVAYINGDVDVVPLTDPTTPFKGKNDDRVVA